MKKVAKKKEITLDDLALMTQGGFNAMETRMDKRFDAVDKRFDAVDKRFNGIDERLDKIEFLLIGRHDKRLDKLEDDMRVIKTLLEKKLGRSIPKS